MITNRCLVKAGFPFFLFVIDDLIRGFKRQSGVYRSYDSIDVVSVIRIVCRSIDNVFIELCPVLDRDNPVLSRCKSGSVLFTILIEGKLELILVFQAVVFTGISQLFIKVYIAAGS